MAGMSFGDSARDKLRALVATVDREIAELAPTGGATATGELRTSWLELVKVLALGPAPETRECPNCGGTGMRAASRCAQCWLKLEPLAASEADLSVPTPTAYATRSTPTTASDPVPATPAPYDVPRNHV